MASTNESTSKPYAVILGVGDGVSASLARLLYKEGYQLILGARNIDKLHDLAQETKASCIPCDATQADQVANLFQTIPTNQTVKVAIYNASLRVKGPLTEVDPDRVHKAMDTTAFGSFLFGQQAAKIMLERSNQDSTTSSDTKGTILFTGASAGVKGFPQSAAFAMGKFAQRGLAQSMARELHPQGIHVAWINIDGAIGVGPAPWSDQPDSSLHPDEIAKTYMALIQQHRFTWTHELEVRPWVETF